MSVTRPVIAGVWLGGWLGLVCCTVASGQANPEGPFFSPVANATPRASTTAAAPGSLEGPVSSWGAQGWRPKGSAVTPVSVEGPVSPVVAQGQRPSQPVVARGPVEGPLSPLVWQGQQSSGPAVVRGPVEGPLSPVVAQVQRSSRPAMTPAVEEPPVFQPSGARAAWEQRVVQGGRSRGVIPSASGLTDYRFSPRLATQVPGNGSRPMTSPRSASNRPVGVFEADSTVPGGAEVVPPGQIQLDQPPAYQRIPSGVFSGVPSGAPYGPGGETSGEFGPGGDCGCGGDWDGCGQCGPVWEGCYPHRGLLQWGFCGWLFEWLIRDMAVFGGVQGFRGPLDVGTNANFGFHEGITTGGPTGLWDIGVQAGFAHASSNLTGDQIFLRNGSNRHQYFFTGGLFRRATCGGLQWGVVLDLLHDDYYDQANLKQIRSETSWIFCGGENEIGYFGVYGLDDDAINIFTPFSPRDQWHTTTGLVPTDMFAAFYRRHFECGGEGRVWAGVTGHGQGIVGGDLRVPLGGRWAIENSFNYVIPKSGRNADRFLENGQIVQDRLQESWSLSMHLVWYPGRCARCADSSCFRPLFGVADNSTFMVTTHDSITVAEPLP